MKHVLKKVALWIDDRSGISAAIKPLMNHPVPPKAKWSYVFGSATLFCFLVQVVTGIGLALLYQPTSESAFQSIAYINNKVTMGKLLRGIHYFGASGMILMAGIHMLRVYVMAAYKYPREMSWISGIVLLILVAAMGFTGQLLRWDDNGVWSAVVGAEQLGRIPLIGKPIAHLLIGGDTIGGSTLSRFFAYHVFIFPGLIFLFVGFHLYLVLRNGISEPPKAGRLVDPATYRAWYKNMLKKEGVPFFPYAAWRDVAFSVGIIFLIVLLAATVGPPALRKPPDPSAVITTPQPDWYLLWIYALYALMPRQIESYLIVFGPLVIFGLLFALPFFSNKGERSPLKRPWAVLGAVSVVVFIATLLYIGKQASWTPRFGTKPLTPKMVAPQKNITDTTVIAGIQLFYSKGCQYCHKVKGHGGIKGPDLSYVGRRLNADELRIQIINGGVEMPGYAQSLTAAEMEQLIAFLTTLK